MANPGFAGTSCSLSGQLMPITTDNKMSVLLAQQAAIQASMIDLKSFCEWNRMGRVAKGIEGKAKELYDMARSEGDKDKAASVLAESTNDGTHWISSISGHPTLKDRSRDEPLSFKTKITIDDVAAFAQTGTLRGKQIVEPNYKLPSLFTTENKKGVPVSKAKKIGACGYIGKIMSIPSCLDNIDQVLQYATPIGPKKGGLTARPSFVRILSSQEYTAGLKAAVLKMHRQFSARKISGDLFTDIQNSFIESGDSKKKANEKTWEVMAVLAATGPNMEIRVSQMTRGEANPNALYLSGIAAMIPHLDTDAMAGTSPRLYSLPKGVEFPCDSGKSYHFWMSAYLSRMLVKNGSDSADARAAAYIAELGYQTQSETLGRAPETIFNWQRFGDTELGVQIDLNLAAAGAHYGANQVNESQVENPRYDIANNLRKSISSMGTSPSGSTGDSWLGLINKVPVRFLENYNPLDTLESYDR